MEDHYGWIGEEQAEWFAERLRDFRDKGWLRVGAVHRNPVHEGNDQERLRDVDTLDSLLGQQLNLLLHGHGTDISELSSSMPLSTNRR